MVADRDEALARPLSSLGSPVLAQLHEYFHDRHGCLGTDLQAITLPPNN